jgi:hypothetical protein
MGKSKIHMNYSFDILIGTDRIEDLSEDGRVIFKLQLTEMGYKDIQRMQAAHNRLQWQALINNCSIKGGELE